MSPPDFVSRIKDIRLIYTDFKLFPPFPLRYIFEEGDDIIEAVEYKIKFTLIVKQPTSISLPKTVTMCPGYPAEVKLNVKGTLFSNFLALFSNISLATRG